jgi:curved DNA-binding protein CbpA
LAFANHPDRAVNEQDRKERTARFQTINEANYVLSNEQRVLLPPILTELTFSAKNMTNLAAIRHLLPEQIMSPPMVMPSSPISSRKHSARTQMLLVFPTKRAGSTKSQEVHRELFWASLSPISLALSADLWLETGWVR